MKTTSIHWQRNSSRFNENNRHAAGDLNRNATKNQAENQRDACEDELYRLRYGIERLLANKDQGDFRDGQRQSRNAYGQSPLGRMKSRMSNWTGSRKKSWFERCTPCCRRCRTRRHDNSNIPNQYPSQHDNNDPSYDSTSRMSSKSAPQTSLHNDPFVSPSPSISSTPHIDSNADPINVTPDINDPAYQSSILKILEAKALDCLCAGYSKDHTQKQISQALSDINHRAHTQRHGSDSHHSRSPSRSSSSKRRRKKKPSKSRSRRSHSRGRTPSSSKSRTKKRSSSKHRRRPSSSHQSKGSSKHRRRPSSSHRSKGSSKHRKKPSSKHRKHSSSPHRKRSARPSTKSKRKPSSSRSHRSKHSSKSASHRSKHKKKKGRGKRSKAKSNNQTDEPDIIHSQICSPSVYRNRQRLLQLLLSSA